MSIQIAPTPILNGKNARRFDKLVKQGLKKPVKFVPVPGLEEVKKEIAKEPEVDWKKAFEMLYKHSSYLLTKMDCKRCPVKTCKYLTLNCAESIRVTILNQCTKCGE